MATSPRRGLNEIDRPSAPAAEPRREDQALLEQASNPSRGRAMIRACTIVASAPPRASMRRTRVFAPSPLKPVAPRLTPSPVP